MSKLHTHTTFEKIARKHYLDQYDNFLPKCEELFFHTAFDNIKMSDTRGFIEVVATLIQSKVEEAFTHNSERSNSNPINIKVLDAYQDRHDSALIFKLEDSTYGFRSCPRSSHVCYLPNNVTNLVKWGKYDLFDDLLADMAARPSNFIRRIF